MIFGYCNVQIILSLPAVNLFCHLAVSSAFISHLRLRLFLLQSFHMKVSRLGSSVLNHETQR